MKLNEFVRKVLYENLPCDINFDINEVIFNISEMLLKDKNEDLNSDSNSFSLSTVALIYYRVSSYLLKFLNLSFAAVKTAEIGFLRTNIYISPKCVIGGGFKLILAQGTKIYDKVFIGNDFLINGAVVICSNTNSENNIIRIGNNVVFENNSSVWGNVKIGDNVLISNNVVVQNDIEKNSVVEIVSMCQITNYKDRSIIPSQKMNIYGVVPKFKNQLVIYGEGFYNPFIDFKIKGFPKVIESEISYWDKNKIILKLKSKQKLLKSDINKNKIIIKSNGYKLIIINANLQKVLNN